MSTTSKMYDGSDISTFTLEAEKTDRQTEGERERL